VRFELEAAPDHVAFWTDVRLPFEPRGAAKDVRDQLRAALSAMAPTGELFATYTAQDSAFCDVENVLLYNVGPGRFALLGARRLVLTRRFASPPPSPSGSCARHHHGYTTIASSPAWRARRSVGERTFDLPSMDGGCAAVWLAARRSVVGGGGVDEVSIASTLGLTVEVEAPKQSPLRLPSMLKALLDGIVCSFHRHDGTGDVPQLAARVASKVKGKASAEEITSLLASGPSELGPRRLLQPFGASVQWNPADDALVLIDARMTRVDSGPPRCRARLVEVDPQPEPSSSPEEPQGAGAQ
jgi:hypothetical protein